MPEARQRLPFSASYLVVGAESPTWTRTLAAFPRQFQDVYLFPEYVRIFAKGGEATAFVYQEPEGTWFYAFVRRPLPACYLVRLGPEVYDIETAYGYGGPISSSDDSGFLQRANDSFAAWCGSNHVIAEFTRFHPLLDNHKYAASDVAVTADRKTYSIDLTGGVEHLESLAPYSSRARTKIRRARRAGWVVKPIGPDDLKGQAEFRRLYEGTMRRKRAAPFYFFDDAFYPATFSFVRQHGFAQAAALDGTVAVASVVIVGPCFAHAHLSGSGAAALRVPGVSNLVLHGSAVESARRGCVRFHLGGGNSADSTDSLDTFKRSMGTDIHTFRIGTRVFDRDRYDEVVSQWKDRYGNTHGQFARRLLCYRCLPGELARK